MAPNDAPFFDTELGSFCWPSSLEGHCAPAGSTASDRYANPSCTEPLLVLPETSCGPPRPWVELTQAGDTCTVERALFQVLGPSATTTAYAEDSTGACVVAPLEEGDVAYEVGPPRPVDSFPTVRIEIL